MNTNHRSFTSLPAIVAGLTLLIALALTGFALGGGATPLPAGAVGSGRATAARPLATNTPVPGTWSTTGSLNTARYWHTATLLANGPVLVAGGYDGASSLASAELYTEAPPVLHVASIDPGYKPLGSRYQVGTSITIQDASGAAVADATVELRVLWPDGTVIRPRFMTNDSGQLISGFITSLTGTYTFCVKDVSKSGWVYDPSQNVETCDSVTIP